MLPILRLGEKSVTFAASGVQKYAQIVGTSEEDLTSDLKVDAKLNETPFNTTLHAAMEGYSVTPRVGDYNQVISRSYKVNSFTLQNGTSIFLWVYLPDDPYTNFYDLKIEFSENGDYVYWYFNFDELYDLMSGMDKVGWKQFELKYNDMRYLTKNYTDIGEKTFSTMTISYFRNTDAEILFPYNSTGKLTIYDVFLADTIGTGNSRINNSLDYEYFSFKNEFFESLDGKYLGDSFTLGSISDVFSYVYVGKTYLPLSGVSNFLWEITYSHGVVAENINWGQALPVFEDVGDYKLTFTLKEQKGSELTTVFSAIHTFSVGRYAFGKFAKLTLEVPRKKSTIIQFSLTLGYNVEQAPVFEVEDPKIAEIEKIEYKNSLGRYYIQVKGLKSGTTTILVTSTGSKDGSSQTETYVESVSISVVGNGISNWMLTFLYVLLGIYGVAFLIFIIISFVKGRRNIVK